jgi:hypothetical protein
MRILSITQLEETLNTIAIRYCTSKRRYDQLKTVELYLDYWPDCKGKEIVRSFEKLQYGKSYDFALYMNKEKFDYESIKTDESLTDDCKEISLLLEKNCKFYFVKKIANKLNSDPNDYLNIIQELTEMSLSGAKDEYSVQDFIDKTIEKNETDLKSGKNKIIIPDFPIWSEQIGGFNAARVSGLSARSGFGKTKMAINLADSARKVMPVYYFNMEMSPEDFESQFLQKNAGITYNEFKSGKYGQSGFERIIAYKASFQDTHPIVFTGGRSLSLDEICAKLASNFKGSGLAIVDYDQKLTFNASQGEEWMMMVRAMERLEEMAKQLSIHIIVLFQADEEGFAKSSKRAIQPLSSFTNFTKSEDGKVHILKNIKNRFGKTGFEIQVDYWPETTLIEEKCLIDDTLKATMQEPKFTTKKG